MNSHAAAVAPRSARRTRSRSMNADFPLDRRPVHRLRPLRPGLPRGQGHLRRLRRTSLRRTLRQQRLRRLRSENLRWLCRRRIPPRRRRGRRPGYRPAGPLAQIRCGGWMSRHPHEPRAALGGRTVHRHHARRIARQPGVALCRHSRQPLVARIALPPRYAAALLPCQTTASPRSGMSALAAKIHVVIGLFCGDRSNPISPRKCLPCAASARRPSPISSSAAEWLRMQAVLKDGQVRPLHYSNSRTAPTIT